MAVIQSVSNFTDEGSPFITYAFASNPTYAEISLTFKTGSYAEADLIGKTVLSSSVTYAYLTLTDADREKLRAGVTVGNNRKIYYLLRWKTSTSGNSYIIENKEATLTLVNYMPTVSISVIDTNSKTVALTGNSSTMIEGYSNAQYTLNPVVKKGATIDTHYVNCGGKYYYNVTGTIAKVPSNTYYLYLNDSRGNSVNNFYTSGFVRYIKLTGALKITGQLSANGNLTFELTGKYFNGSFGAQNNSFSVSYKLSKNGGAPTTYNLGAVSPTVENNNYTYSKTITGLDYASQYELTVTISDKLETITLESKVVTGAPVFDWGKEDFKHYTDVYLEEGKSIIVGDTEVIKSNDAGEVTINANDIYINDNNLADYVIEEGSAADGWYYRKWNSGKADLYGAMRYMTPCNTALGGWYRSAVLTAPEFPFILTNPKVVMTYESDGTGALVWNTTTATSTEPPNFYLIRPTSSSSISGKVIIHAHGEWI